MNAITNTATASQPQSDIEKIKARQKATWEDGDYADFATYMHAGAVDILQNWDLGSAQSILDVGCGSGQTAIPAAKKGLQVTGIDIAANLIDHARRAAARAKLDVQFDVGDAEDLPYADQRFDAAISLIGAMFAPRPEQVAAELARVIKPGGQLFMANWTPASMQAQMFKCVSEIQPPPPGLVSPVLWGDELTVQQRLAEGFTDIRLARKIYPQWQYPLDEYELVDLFRHTFGPVKRAFDAGTPAQQTTLREKLVQVYRTNSERKNGILTITGGEYLEVIATRR